MREHARFQVSGYTKDHKFHFGGRSETPNWTAEAAASHAFHFHHHDGSVLPHTHRTHQRSAAAHCVITPAITREGSRELQWHFTHTHMVTHTPMQQPPTRFLCFSSNTALAPLCSGRKCDSNDFSYVSQTVHVGGRKQHCKCASLAYMYEFVKNSTKVLLSFWQMTDMYLCIGNFKKCLCSCVLTRDAGMFSVQPWKSNSLVATVHFICIRHC